MSKFCFYTVFLVNLFNSFFDALLILIVFKVLRWLFVYLRNYVAINKINGPKPILFLGNILNIKKKYGKLQKFYNFLSKRNIF